MRSLSKAGVNRAKTECGVMIAALLLAGSGLSQERADTPPEPAAIPADQFVKLHTLIKPQPGELRFHEIPWLIDVWEARKKAALVPRGRRRAGPSPARPPLA